MRQNMTTFLKTTSFLLLFVLFSGLSVHTAIAQDDPELIAKDLVENGQYAKALPYFKDLVRLYPSDKVLNYYLGMCLAETEQFSATTKKALETSLGDNTPKKSLYYLGECFQAENNFPEALNYYQQFDDQAKNREKRDTRLDELIKLCQEKINPFTNTVAKQKQEEKDTSSEVVPQEIPTDTIAVTAPAPIQEKPNRVEIPEGLEDSLINFQVNSDIQYLKISQFKNPTSLKAFILAWQDQQELKQLLRQASQLRAEYDTVVADRKQAVANKILSLEKKTYAKNQKINQKYEEARKDERSYWSQASPETIKAFSDRVNFMQDSILQAKKEVRIKKLEAEKPVILPDSLVKAMTPEQVAPVDNGVTYKIQIGAYSKTPPDWVQRLFKKLSVIRRIDKYTDNKGVTVYTVGELKSYKDALQMQSQVRQEGVKDAFVAAYKNGERIPLTEARKIAE